MKKCCISLVDGSQIDMLQNDSEEAGNGSSKCNEERGTDCEDPQSTDNKGAENDTDW
jgi:hypothetical protein